MDEWFYSKQGHKLGPVSSDKLREQLAVDAINSSTLVWKTGLSDWIPLGECSNLSGILSELPPPLPSTQDKEPTIGTEMPPLPHSSTPELSVDGGDKCIDRSGGLGIVGKLGLTLLVIVAGGLVYGLIRDLLGQGHYFWTAAEGLLLIYIWSRPS